MGFIKNEKINYVMTRISQKKPNILS